MLLDEYQEIAGQTDHLDPGLNTPLLGLFGETGGLLTELKKKQRGEDAYASFAETSLEELGDVLWYFSTLCSRAGYRLSDVASIGGRRVQRFSELAAKREVQIVSEESVEKRLFRLAGNVGALLGSAAIEPLDRDGDQLKSQLAGILDDVVEAADSLDFTLEDAASANIRKILSRWQNDPSYPPLFDEGMPEDEQLPRRIEMVLREKERDGMYYVVQKCRDIIIGDQLTDNKMEPDDYRFHDVFHLSFAAFLGWSPVMRALFRVKRKSKPEVDENQDGARAILIEEGISAWIFIRAQKLDLLAGIKKLDYDLLKSTQQFVEGYEVERCDLWQWERAILEGYKVFRKIKRHRKGMVVADLHAHSLEFTEIE